jgi:hypothetical protein
MKKWLVLASLGAALTLPMLVAPATASASCSDRKATGTVLGGVGGALIGNSIARGGGGAILGGVGGAVVGHEVARGTCGDHRSYRTSRRRHYGQGETATASTAAPGGAACRTETQSYYDDRGALATRQVQVCGR